MGFSSLTCAKTNIPIAAPDASADAAHTGVVLLAKGKLPVHGHLDGYSTFQPSAGGRASVDLYGRHMQAALRAGKAKFVLAVFHEPGEPLDALGFNRRDPGQGLHESGFLRECHAAGGFRSYEGMLLAWQGTLVPSKASGLGNYQAQAVNATLKALGEKVSRLRMDAMDAAFEEGKRIYPHHLSIAPADESNATWVSAPIGEGRAATLHEAVDPAFAAACGGVGMRVDGKVAPRKEIRAAALALVQALPVATTVSIPLLRDGEEAGEARACSCPMGAKWYEVRMAGEAPRAFIAPQEAARAYGLDEAAMCEALWGQPGAPTEIEVEPSAGPAP